MNICIDAFGVTNLKGTGHYTYTKNLIEGLIKSYPQPFYSLLWQGSDMQGWGKSGRLSFVDLNIDRRGRDLYKLEQHLEAANVSIFHSPNNGFSIPNKKICKNVLTVHDLIAKTDPKLVDTEYKKNFDNMFESTLMRADRIVAVSKFIKWELEKNYKINPEKISVIYPWYNPGDMPEKLISLQLLRYKYNITDEFILSIGSLHPRKNLAYLIRAYKASALHREGIKLVIAGMTGGKRQYYYERLKELVESLELSESVIFTGIIEHEDVKHFYNCASCMVNISEYEGFPQVCLEALALGTPVICSSNSSFQEVLGDGGNYVEGRDIVQIRDQLRAFALSLKEERTIGLIKNSIEFSEEASIKKIVSLYENIV